METTIHPFVTASRRQLRFTTNKGPISVEELWMLSLKSLDAIATAVSEVIAPGTKSFLTNPDRRADQESKDNELRLEILKIVIQTIEAENAAKLSAASVKQERETLMALLEKKQLASLENLSEEEIKTKLAAIGG